MNTRQKKPARQKEIYILVNAAKCSGRGILHGFLSVLGERSDFRLHICEMSDYGRKSLLAAIRDGLIDGLVTSEIEDPELAHAFESGDFPLVVIGTRERCLPKRRANLRVITRDEMKLAAFATRHLLDCGRFASYGYVHFREDFCRYLSDCREKGFLAELARSGLTGTVYRSVLPEEVSDVRELGQWLAALPKPAALLAGYDRRAMDILDACGRTGIRVPDEVRVIGIDNDEIICQQTKPNLSSVTTDNISEGRVAAQQLVDLLRRPHATVARKDVLFRPSGLTVVERESTHVLAPGLALVQRARDYIAANANRAISTEDVITHLGVSRRLAYLRFREFEHTSIHQAILLARIAHVKKRLLGSRQTIDAISRDCGFENPNNLTIIFRRLTGMTMREWRARNARPAPRK